MHFARSIPMGLWQLHWTDYKLEQKVDRSSLHWWFGRYMWWIVTWVSSFKTLKMLWKFWKQKPHSIFRTNFKPVHTIIVVQYSRYHVCLRTTDGTIPPHICANWPLRFLIIQTQNWNNNCFWHHVIPRIKRNIGLYQMVCWESEKLQKYVLCGICWIKPECGVYPVVKIFLQRLTEQLLCFWKKCDLGRINAPELTELWP